MCDIAAAKGIDHLESYIFPRSNPFSKPSKTPNKQKRLVLKLHSQVKGGARSQKWLGARASFPPALTRQPMDEASFPPALTRQPMDEIAQATESQLPPRRRRDQFFQGLWSGTTEA